MMRLTDQERLPLKRQVCYRQFSAGGSKPHPGGATQGSTPVSQEAGEARGMCGQETALCFSWEGMGRQCKQAEGFRIGESE